MNNSKLSSFGSRISWTLIPSVDQILPPRWKVRQSPRGKLYCHSLKSKEQQKNFFFLNIMQDSTLKVVWKFKIVDISGTILHKYTSFTNFTNKKHLAVVLWSLVSDKFVCWLNRTENPSNLSLFFPLSLFGATGVWIQGLGVSRQVFYLLNHTLSSFSTLVNFYGKILCFYPKLASDWYSPTYVSYIAGITGAHHHIQIIEMVSC
jgi:hypothetical protein